MPKLSRLHVTGRLKAFNVAIHALQLELNDPKDDAIYEHLTEIRFLLDKLRRERKLFAEQHLENL